MTSASKVCSLTWTTYEAPPAEPPGAAGRGLLGPFRHLGQVDSTMAAETRRTHGRHPVKAAARLRDGPQPRADAEEWALCLAHSPPDRPDRQNVCHGSPTRRTAGITRRPDRRRRRDQCLLRPDAGSGESRPAGLLRYFRTPWIEPRYRVQRRAHRGHRPGDRGVSSGPGHHRSTVHRQGHPRFVQAGLDDGS